MIINELLVDKYRVQKALDQDVGHSLTRYVSETHARVANISKTLGLSFKYGTPGIVESEPNKTLQQTPVSPRRL